MDRLASPAASSPRSSRPRATRRRPRSSDCRAPSSAKRVIDLERALGARLLERTTRRVKVNRGRRRLLRARAAPASLELDDSDASVRLLHDAPRGTLARSRRRCPSRLLHMKPVVTAYLARNPEVAPVALAQRPLRRPDRRGLRRRPSASRRPKPRASSRARSRPRAACCAPRPRYLKKHGTPKTPDDLAAASLPALRPPASRRATRLAT